MLKTSDHVRGKVNELICNVASKKRGADKIGEGGERHRGHHARSKNTDRCDKNETGVCRYGCKCTSQSSTKKYHFTEKHLSRLRRVLKLTGKLSERGLSTLCDPASLGPKVQEAQGVELVSIPLFFITAAGLREVCG